MSATAAVLVAAASGPAQAFPLYYIQENCTDCSPVTANGIDSSSPITPFFQTRTQTSSGGSTAGETVGAGADKWRLGAVSSAGVIIVPGGGGASGTASSTAAQIIEIPLNPTALFPVGTAMTLSLNYLVTGSLQTPPFAPPTSCCLPNGNSQTILASRSFLAVNTAPQDYLNNLHLFGFAADFHDDGDFHADETGFVSGTGGFAGVSPNGAFIAPMTGPSLTVHIGDTLIVGLGIFTAASEQAFIEGAFTADADLSHTLTLSTMGLVFNGVPDGYDLTTDDGLIVNNRFVGFAAAAAPEPATLAALGLGLLGLGLARRRRP